MLCLVFSFITLSSNSQTIDYITGNIVQPTVQGSGTTPWTGGVYQDSLTCWANGDPGYCGPNAIVRPGNFINFSYGSTYLYQQQNVAALLPTDIGNIKVTGYNFSFNAKNGNGWDDGRVDQLTALVRFWDTTGGRGTSNLLYGNSYNLNYKFNWTTFTYDQNLPTPIDSKLIGQVQYGFIGKDNNGWAGPYGPEIYNVSFRLKYSTDPCATNPAYSSSCAGFGSVLTSTNLVPNPTASASWGGAINNSFAINTALQHSGTGMSVHGFDYGYNVYAAQSYCAFELIWCFDWRQGGTAQVNVGITNAAGQSIYSVSRNYAESGYTPQNFQYRFPSSINQTQLGNFNFTAYTSGDAAVSGMYANMVYSQDPCFFNPDYSPQCTNKPKVTTTTTTTTSSQAYGTTSLNVGGVEMSTTGEISAPTGLPVISTGTQTSSTDTSSTSTVIVSPTITTVSSTGQSTTTSTNSVAQVQQQSNSKAGPNMNLVMSAISKVQAADKATQANAVANAQQVVATSSAKAQEQANQVVDQANALSTESSQASQTLTSSSTIQQGSRQQNNTNSSVVAVQGPNVMSLQSLTASASSYQGPNIDTSGIQRGDVYNESSIYSLTPNNVQRYTPGVSLNSQFNGVAITSAPIQMIQQRQEFKFENRSEQEQPQSFQVPQTAMTRGTILNDIIEQRLNFGSMQMEQQMDTVKKNVLPNELAGGVDITSIATIPKGYEAYSIVTLRDVPFYKAEPIYKDQKTIDNARVFRGLTGGSDAKHQEMVNSQYKLGD